MTFEPDWSRVCRNPDDDGWFHVWLDLGDHQHRYWCKRCVLDGADIVQEDDRQTELWDRAGEGNAVIDPGGHLDQWKELIDKEVAGDVSPQRGQGSIRDNDE